ncbi:LysR family transcriptional regulator [Falsiroseomonas sp. HW251]|uniref:LysR family transcriptional regulator n=1 Tax=Falsiroseomonas sp. HW251 TaxID=3390998 RepID=UPI003D31302F
MNKFAAISVFARVAECGGFTPAARRLGMSVSAVTKAIARLENDLGTQLFNRTTRQLSTTEAGQEFYDRCARILADLDDAEAMLRNLNTAAEGRVRAVVPFSFGRVTLVPELPAFLARHPHLSVELSFSDLAIDLVAEGYDLAVRTGPVQDSQLTRRLLTRGAQVTAAAPAYLATRGVPHHPRDLREHNCIIGRFGPAWSFIGEDGRPLEVRVGGNALINSGDALREAGAAGLGIVQGTHWLFRKDLEAGRLVPILESFAAEGAPITVLYVGKRHLPQKVRVFLDFLTEITRTG